MKTIVLSLLCSCVCVGACWAEDSNAEDARRSIRAVVLTGGHKYDEEAFRAMFNSFEGVECDFVELDETSKFFDDISDWPYDVAVFYHFKRGLSTQGKENIGRLCEQGVGMFVLHHGLVGFYDWPEFIQLSGGMFYFEDTQVDGETYTKSTYKYEMHIPVKIADSRHPITQGMDDFTLFDETFGNLRTEPGNHALLATDEPTSQKEIGWTRTYKHARVFYLQPGHDANAFEDANYRRLVGRGIRWCAEGE